MLILCRNISDITLITLTGIEHRCIIHSFKTIVYNYNFGYLMKATKKIETEHILINEENYKYLIIYFTKYDFLKSIRMFSLYMEKLLIADVDVMALITCVIKNGNKF